MRHGNLAAKISGIEIQLKILKSESRRADRREKKGLRNLKGICKGLGKFTDKDIKDAEIRVPDDL